MRYILFLLFSFFSVLSLSQDKKTFSILSEKHPTLSSSLSDFKKNGVEKILKTDSISVQQLIDSAKSFLGTPHCMGGISHSCIDCSGLIYASFKCCGIDVPHSSQALARYGKIIIEPDSLIKGDLIFFVNTYSTSKFITHAGIYVGDLDFIHTSASRGVVISNLKSNYYKKHFIFGTRIFD